MTDETTPETADTVTLIAYLEARPGAEPALIAAITAILPAVLAEDGCLDYRAHLLAQASGTVVMYERWRDQQAFEAHAAGPAFTGLAARFDDLLGAPLRLEFLDPL
ncbi:putative quinol monooxygenase [Xanthobacter sp. V4C-4]|uniref:putative quinol monooxygenase n=1 Tax=Xanthobacter cornucopiae TaxID=3119924 RepID=UPI003729EF7D